MAVSLRSAVAELLRRAGSDAAAGSGAADLRVHLVHFLPDLDSMALTEEERADHEGHERDADHPVQAGIDVSGLRNEDAGDERQRAAEPAVAEVVREREGGVAD